SFNRLPGHVVGANEVVAYLALTAERQFDLMFAGLSKLREIDGSHYVRLLFGQGEGMGGFTVYLDNELADGRGCAFGRSQEQGLQGPDRGLRRPEVAQTVFASRQLVQTPCYVIRVAA